MAKIKKYGIEVGLATVAVVLGVVLICVCNGKLFSQEGSGDPQANQEGQAIELKATWTLDFDGYKMTASAATCWDGTVEKPKKLLAGLNGQMTDDPEVFKDYPLYRVCLSAYADKELKQGFPAGSGFAWTITKADGTAATKDEAIFEEKDTNKDTVTMVAYEADIYVVKAKVTNAKDKNTGSEQITIYCAEPKVTSGPAYLFADADQKAARVPFEFYLKGAKKTKFEIGTTKEDPFFWRFSCCNMLKVPGENGVDPDSSKIHCSDKYNLDKGHIGDTWEANADKNGAASSYCVVSEISNQLRTFEFDQSNKKLAPNHINTGGRLCIGCAATLNVSETEKTNKAILLPNHWFAWAPDWNNNVYVRIADKHVPAVMIGVDEKKYLLWQKPTSDRYWHLQTDDPDFPCSGFNYLDKSDTFTANHVDAGGKEGKYYLGIEQHYHPGDLDKNEGGPRGFGGKNRDIALIGMTEEFTSKGFVVEGQLYDDPDQGNESDDGDEVYEARSVGTGILMCVAVSYGTTRTGFYPEYLDLKNVEGNAHPGVFPSGKWKISGACSVAGDAQGMIGKTLDITSGVLAGLSIVAVFTGPVGWCAVATFITSNAFLLSASAVVSSAAIINDWAYTDYQGEDGVAVVRQKWGQRAWGVHGTKTSWDESDDDGLDLSIPVKGNNAEVNLGAGGVWGAGYSPVHVGDEILYACDIQVSVKNMSASGLQKRNAEIKCELEGKDLDAVNFTWKK